MRVVPRRTVVGDIDRRFDNLSGSHHQSHEQASGISNVLDRPTFIVLAGLNGDDKMPFLENF